MINILVPLSIVLVAIVLNRYYVTPKPKRSSPDKPVRYIYHMIKSARCIDELYAAQQHITWLSEKYYDMEDIREVCEELEEERTEALARLRGEAINPIYGNSITN